ncbi:MAG TPA: SCO family protein [Marmoricola sp.]|nr:SCO family protein [Marmoricola sp.]
MADRGRAALAVVLAVVAIAVSGCGGSTDDGLAVSGVQTGDNHGYHGTFFEDPYVVPDLSLPDTSGKDFSVAASPAPLKIVFFGYSNCPDICQIVMSTIAGAVTRLDSAQKKDVQVVFVTTDPARDTGPVLREYLDRFNPDFVGVTGRLSRIIELGKPLGVYVDKGQKLPSGGYEVDHSTHVYGIVGNQARVAWGQGTSPAQMSADIIRLLKS